MHLDLEHRQSNFNRPRLTRLLIALYLVAVCGCGNPHGSRLTGKWQLEESTRLEDRVTEVADRGQDSRMTLDFRGGGRFYTQTSMGNIESEKQGTWRVIDFDEASSVLKINCQIDVESTEHEVEFLSEDLIQLAPPNMAGLTLKLKFRRQ